MNHGRKISTRAKIFLGALGLLAGACASAQAPLQSQSRVVPLGSDTCPTAHIGDRVSFDWNPIFDPIGPVTGLHDVSLMFSGVADDGVSPRRQELHLGGRNAAASVTPLANGFFHVEATLSPRSIQPGIYRLTRVNANAEVASDYAGEPPQMTRSPVEERYCITVIPY
jgi:hypothetical protein